MEVKDAPSIFQYRKLPSSTPQTPGKKKQINFPLRGGLLVSPPKQKRPPQMASVLYTNRNLIDLIRTRMLH